MAEGSLSPHSGPTTTSLGTPRIVRVSGATVTVFNTPIMSDLVSRSTGRCLSGACNLEGDEPALSDEPRGHRDQAIEGREAPGASVEGHPRLTVAHLGRQTGQILGGHIRRVGHDAIEAAR